MNNLEIREVLKWLGNTIETFDINLGEYEASLDEHAQIQTWHCLGCDAECFSKWPDWKIEFKHKQGCMYQRLKDLIENY